MRAICKIFCILIIHGVICQMHNVQALRCYECGPDESKSDSKVSKACVQGGTERNCPGELPYCTKFDGNFGGGRRVMSRGCVTEARLKREGRRPNRCSDVRVYGVEAIICTCNTELCNSTENIRGWSAVRFGLVSIVIIRIY